MANVTPNPAAAGPHFLPFQLVAIGASAGALQPLLDVLARLPGDFSAPVVVVHHLGAQQPSHLPEVLSRASALPCRWAEAGERPQSGEVLVAPPGANLVLAPDGRLARVATRKPRLGWPSIDAFFQSMAATLGRRCVAVILSGALSDGAEGVSAVRRSGGATLAQHPRTARFPSMPAAAVDLGRADLLMTPEQIGEALAILAEQGVI